MNFEKRYCQSCGMPLKLGAEHLLGSNADNTKSEDFCFYCLKDGEYTVDYSMEQMINVWIKYTDKYNAYSSTQYTPEQLRTVLSQRMPTLRRWKQKINTENTHYESVNIVLAYINRHLFDELEVGDLACIAKMSLFHFRRIFRQVTGENIGTYIKRIRLEYIAYQLISSSQPVKQLPGADCYQNIHGLSKAFRNHFGLSPSEYRRRNQVPGEQQKENPKHILSPDIMKINSMSVIGIQVGETYKDMREYRGMWKQLMCFAEKNGLTQKNKYLSISFDDPAVTVVEKCRFYIGITVGNTVKPSGRFSLFEIPAGLYAVFRFQGHYSMIHQLYHDIYLLWLPESEYRQREPLTFEIYLNNPQHKNNTELIADVYIPVEKIRLPISTKEGK